MISFLFGIILFILFIIFFGLSLIGKMVNFIFGPGNSPRRTSQHQQQRQYEDQYKSQQQRQSSQEGKIFSKDEGEYVEFEEI